MDLLYGPKERPLRVRVASVRQDSLPKVNRFGWNFEHCETNVGGWPWQTLGAICAVATVWEGAEIFVCGKYRTISAISPSEKFYISTQQRRSVRRWKLSEHNSENFTIRGRFFQKKTKKLLKTFASIATLGRHSSAMITNAKNSRLNSPHTGCLVSVLKVRIKSLSLRYTLRTRKHFWQGLAHVYHTA